MATLTVTPTTFEIRKTLGDFSSIVCFKAVVTGIEEALGEKAAAIALIAAGRKRGKGLTASLGLSNRSVAWEEVTQLLQTALGPAGTRLCLVNKIEADGDSFRVYCQETICSSQEPQGSDRTLTYTLGVLQGAIEEITGQRLRGKQVASVLRGSDHDVVEFSILG